MIRNEQYQTNTEDGETFFCVEKTLFDIVERVSTCVRFQVNGFWSSDPITVYINREYIPCSQNTMKWVAEISWCSGGRDKKTVPSDVIASKNFASALQAASKYAQWVEDHSEELETAYQMKYHEKD